VSLGELQGFFFGGRLGSVLDAVVLG